MTTPVRVLGGLLALALSGLALASPTPERQQALTRLVRDDCGACHGLRLQGGLGTPLTREALAGKPVDSLVVTVMFGRPGTAMPPWKPFMSEAEARWIIDTLQAGGLGEAR